MSFFGKVCIHIALILFLCWRSYNVPIVTLLIIHQLTLVFFAVVHLICLFIFGAFAQEVSDNVNGQRKNNGRIFLCRYWIQSLKVMKKDSGLFTFFPTSPSLWSSCFSLDHLHAGWCSINFFWTKRKLCKHFPKNGNKIWLFYPGYITVQPHPKDVRPFSDA